MTHLGKATFVLSCAENPHTGNTTSWRNDSRWTQWPTNHGLDVSICGMDRYQNLTIHNSGQFRQPRWQFINSHRTITTIGWKLVITITITCDVRRHPLKHKRLWSNSLGDKDRKIGQNDKDRKIENYETHWTPLQYETMRLSRATIFYETSEHLYKAIKIFPWRCYLH